MRKARWDEIDLEAAIWTVPADRMKMQREHRVPLSGRALQVLTEARNWADGSGWIFPSVTGRPLSDNTLSKLLREQGIPAVVHGFRSSFRNWCAECSNAPREVCELALAHVNSNRVEAAYMRSDLFELRRTLMQSWADYVSTGGVNGQGLAEIVKPLRRRNSRSPHTAGGLKAITARASCTSSRFAGIRIVGSEPPTRGSRLWSAAGKLRAEEFRAGIRDATGTCRHRRR